MSSPAVQPLLALLAFPVGGNPTQYLVERAFTADDLDWRYLTFEVSPEDLAAAVGGLRALGFRGVHCDEPHKRAIVPLLDRITETAAAVGAVNFIYREDAALIGDNNEGRGVVEALRRAVDLTGKQVVMLGAGRLAHAAALELAAAGAAGLTIVARDAAKAGELASRLEGKFASPVAGVACEGEYAATSEAEIIIFAPAAEDEGGEDERLTLSPIGLRPALIVADATPMPAPAELIRQAAENGCKTIDALGIFIEQISIGLQLWTGADPDRQILREAAEEFLGL
ncbi:MAG: shikimate dehydrogenase [Pirellulaceae bacterium]|nr:shikimate dehydrogenase [Pirellulaceae bacterium]